MAYDRGEVIHPALYGTLYQPAQLHRGSNTMSISNIARDDPAQYSHPAMKGYALQVHPDIPIVPIVTLVRTSAHSSLLRLYSVVNAYCKQRAPTVSGVSAVTGGSKAGREKYIEKLKPGDPCPVCLVSVSSLHIYLRTLCICVPASACDLAVGTIACVLHTLFNIFSLLLSNMLLSSDQKARLPPVLGLP